MSGISIDSYLLSTYTENKAREAKSTLGKDDFLKLLITQLQYQDPLNPMEDKEFIAQMANFSTLEQITNMNKSLEAFLKSDALIKYSQLIGKSVEYSKEGEQKQSVVKSVRMNGNTVIIALANGDEVESSSITKVSEAGENDSSDQEG